jgi:hypothetical protein
MQSMVIGKFGAWEVRFAWIVIVRSGLHPSTRRSITQAHLATGLDTSGCTE